MGPFKDIAVEGHGHVSLVEIRRPPYNFFDVALIREIAEAFETLDRDATCRALVLAAQGKAFCAGAAVGGGLGLAMVADFRVTCPQARFSANFTRLGFHPGFGLTVTLPQVIGTTKAALMFYTSRRVTGEEAYAMGLADVLVPQDEVRAAALKLAGEIAENAPLGLVATRATLRGDLADRVLRATEHELREQTRLRKTDDFKEGVRAVAERRVPNFKGR